MAGTAIQVTHLVAPFEADARQEFGNCLFLGTSSAKDIFKKA